MLLLTFQHLHGVHFCLGSIQFSIQVRSHVLYNMVKIYVKIFCACLFSVHKIISLSRDEQVSLVRLRFERYFSGQHQETYYNTKNTTAFSNYIRNVPNDNDKLLISSEVTLLYTNILIIADVAMGGTASSTTTNIYR